MLLNRITTDPRILAGKPVLRDLRISVEQLLKALAAGQTEADLLVEYPGWSWLIFGPCYFSRPMPCRASGCIA